MRFSYDVKTDVLKDCNLHIPQGEKVAVVGASGAGKSTIIELVSRFYDVEDGEILIGGKNVKEIDYTKLLDNISIVRKYPHGKQGQSGRSAGCGKRSTD